MGETWSWSDVGRRVREARVAAGLSQEALGRRLGLGRTVVAKIESGTREIDALELAKLAAVLALPLGHFLTEPPAVLSRRAELLDDTVSDLSGQSYRLEAALQAWLADVRQLVDLGVLEPPARRLYPGVVEHDDSARQAARWVREECLRIGSAPIDTLMSVCQAMGQLVAVVDVPGDGASLIEGDLAVSVVGRMGDPGRRRTTAAHELGHFVLGDEYSSDLGVAAPRDERERVINSFAAELLLPVSAIKERATDGVCSRQALVRLAAEYRTSWSLAVNQAVGAGLASSVLVRNTPTRAELQEAIGWAPQPDLESISVPPIYADAVLKAWRASLITAARAEEMMRGELLASDLPDREEFELEP